MFCLRVCLSVSHLHAWCSSRPGNGVWESLRLELHMIVDLYVDAGDWTPDLLKSSYWAISPALDHPSFKKGQGAIRHLTRLLLRIKWDEITSAHNTAYSCVWQNNERQLLLLTKLEQNDEQTFQTAFFQWVFFVLTNHVSSWNLNSSAPFGKVAFYFSSCFWKWEDFSAAGLLGRAEWPLGSLDPGLSLRLGTQREFCTPTSRWRHSSAHQPIVRPWHQTSSFNPTAWILPKGQFHKGLDDNIHSFQPWNWLTIHFICHPSEVLIDWVFSLAWAPLHDGWAAIYKI